MSTCNRLDLQTVGSQPVMPKNLPDHCVYDDIPKSRKACSPHYRNVMDILHKKKIPYNLYDVF